MRLTEHVYQLSGVPFGTNSNAYAIDAGDQIVLIDAGCSPVQWKIMMGTLATWGLSQKPVSHTLITHCHFDHAANAYLAQEIGSCLVAGEPDADAMRQGDERTICQLFDTQYHKVSVDKILYGEQFLTVGNCKIRCIPMPGHTAGSYMFEIKDGGQNCLFMGDFIAIDPVPPEDDVTVRLAWTGGIDYNREQYLSSLKKACDMQSSILMPGHYYCFYGDSHRLFQMAYELGKKEL